MLCTAFPLRAFAGLALISCSLALAGCRRAEGAAPAELAVTIRVDESLLFRPRELRCAPGQTIRLRIINQIAANGPDLPHNFVLLSPGTDIESFANAAIGARAEDGYVPARFKSAVLFTTSLVHPARQTEVVLQAPHEPGNYPYVCSFPGHCLMGMTGRLIVN
jgi:azurin